MGKWQPINTAPKDGTAILGYAEKPPIGFGGYAVVSWDDDDEAWNLSQSGSYAEDRIWWPEYWQPLPVPPEKPNE